MSEVNKKKILDDYNEDSIQVLEGLEGVRVRPAMYIGTTASPGLHHLVWEIIDNSVDEALNGYGNKISVVIHKDGSITVSDEGRGIPCGIHKKEKIPTIQLLLTTLHSGGKFNANAYTASGGLHGVGSSVTNALSEFFDAVVCRDGKIYHIRFEDGGRKLVQPLEIIGNTTKHGTTITFKPDKRIFQTIDFKYDVIKNHMQESAFLLQNVHFCLKDERINNEVIDFYYKDGLSEYIRIINQNKKALSEPVYFEDVSNSIKIKIALQYCSDDYNETILSYVNNVRTKEGGTHESGFKIALTKAINEYAEENKLLKYKQRFESSDVREGLTVIISLNIPATIIQFEGQTKTKLGTSEALNAVSNFFYDKFSHYLNENKQFAIDVVGKCLQSQNERIQARKAKEEVRTNKKTRNELPMSNKLCQAQSKNYKLNELFIVEGDSAGGSAKTARDHMYQAILPLRGKPLNVDSISTERMLKNEEFSTLIATIGAGFGANFDISNCKYGKIIIMTDADTDGAHIQTLLLTFFYHYMRPLINEGMIYVAVSPLYRVFKGDTKNPTKEVYCWNNEDLEKGKKEVGPGYHIQRYKGLGEMDPIQLRNTTMKKDTRQLIRVTIDDPLLVEQRIRILMGNDSNERRKWVEENIDFNEVDNFKDEVR